MLTSRLTGHVRRNAFLLQALVVDVDVDVGHLAPASSMAWLRGVSLKATETGVFSFFSISSSRSLRRRFVARP